jgi:hypothetical protein
VKTVDDPLPAVPPDPSDEAGFDDIFTTRNIDVGAFEQGTGASRWAWARYLVGRAVGESLSRGLLIVAIVVLALAALVEWAGSTFWAVVIAIVALGVLVLRALLGAVLRRLTALGAPASVDQRLRAMVADTRKGVLAELRRVGLPGRTWTLPLLAVRLLRRRTRPATMQRLRTFAIDNVVPPARVDELQMLIRAGRDRPS